MSDDIARLAAVPAPSSLLRHLAGEAAEALAVVLPPPHLPYLAAAAPQRHLIGMTLAVGAPLNVETASGALAWSLGQAIRLLLPDAPPGLKRALGRMGETGWPLESYRRLLRLLRRSEIAKALRHATALDPAAIDGLAEIPAALLEAGVARFGLCLEYAETARDCFAALVERDGVEPAEALAREWGKARTAKSFFERVEEDLQAEPVLSPFPATPRLRWLGTKAEMRDAARRYRNCLANYLVDAARGEAVFGEWLDTPGAIIQVSRDAVFGWRLEQARGLANKAVAGETRNALGAELCGFSIRIGRSGRDLRLSAGRAAVGETRSEHWREDFDEVFEEAR
ncbi:MAG TPA: hypothetical protein VHZ26_06500 [Caulobacteraceae bacterium]|jgi:hypothetical protein|nr:hypothetical protein [Caulobacteraceae bacterium]